MALGRQSPGQETLPPSRREENDGVTHVDHGHSSAAIEAQRRRTATGTDIWPFDETRDSDQVKALLWQ